MHSRRDERNEIAFHLANGRSLLMLAPRRIGKTWVMDQVARDLAGDGWLVVQVDVEGMASEAEFMRRLCTRLEEAIQAQDGAGARVQMRAHQLLTQIFTGDLSDWKATLGRTEWASFADTLLKRLNAQGQKTAILVDELALFVAALLREDPDRASQFLYKLRGLVQAYRNVRWLLSGSIGLDVLAKQAGIGGALLSLTLFALPPFSPEASASFIDWLGDEGRILHPFTLDERGLSHLAEQLGWLSPFYLELIASFVRPSGGSGAGGRPLATTADIDAALDRLLAREHRQYFVAWEEHIDKNFDEPTQAAMREILGHCAMAPAGIGYSTLLAVLGSAPFSMDRREVRKTVDFLISDGFLDDRAPDGDGKEARLAFKSGVLRRYWERFHA